MPAPKLLASDATRRGRIAVGAILVAQAVGWGTLVWLSTRQRGGGGNLIDGVAAAVIITFLANLVAFVFSIASLVAGRGGARLPAVAVVALILALLGFCGTLALAFFWALAAMGTK